MRVLHRLHCPSKIWLKRSQAVAAVKVQNHFQALIKIVRMGATKKMCTFKKVKMVQKLLSEIVRTTQSVQILKISEVLIFNIEESLLRNLRPTLDVFHVISKNERVLEGKFFFSCTSKLVKFYAIFNEKCLKIPSYLRR